MNSITSFGQTAVTFCWPKAICCLPCTTFTQYQSNFQLVEKFDQTLCSLETAQYLVLFTQNCRTIVFPCKGSHNTTRKSMFAISSLFAAEQPRIHATKPLLYKNLASHGVHTLPFKCLTVVVKNLTLNFIIERQDIQIFVWLARFHVNGIPNHMNFRQVENWTSTK